MSRSAFDTKTSPHRPTTRVIGRFTVTPWEDDAWGDDDWVSPAQTRAPAAQQASASDPGFDDAEPMDIDSDTDSTVTARPVGREVWRRLQEADRAIRDARRLTPDGMGNQRGDILASRGASYARVAWTRRLLPFGGQARQVSRATAYTGGANCSEMSALTFANLANRGVRGPIQRVVLGHTDHAFTWIGDPRQSNETVVVDGWLRAPQAHLWRDSRWNDARFVGGDAIVAETWNGGQPDPTYDLSDVKTQPISLREEIPRLGYAPDTWLVGALLDQDAQRPYLWNATHPGRGNERLAYTPRQIDVSWDD